MKPKRVVDIVDQTPDSQTVKIRNLHEPIFIELWRIAHDKIQQFQTDLAHDVLALSTAMPGERFLWGYRDTGTTLFQLKSYQGAERVAANMAEKTCPLENWYIIEILKVRVGGHADGFVTWINAKNYTDLLRAVQANVVPEVANLQKEE